jgi:AcrR family transcriptional regulator
MPRVELRPLEWVKTPQQRRSHQTMERLLDAAEELMMERGYESTTVADVVRRAGSSVGAFYARFADKDALVRCLLSRFVEQAIATTHVALGPDRWATASDEELFRDGIAFLVAICRQRARLVAAFVRLLDGDLHSVQDQLADAVTASFLRVMESRGTRIGRSNPEAAINFLWRFTLDSLFGRAIQIASGVSGGLADAVLARELANMCLAYLNIESDQGGV